MPVITLIKPQKTRKRFNVYLDGQFSFSVDQETLLKLKLKKDLKVSLAELTRLRREAFKAKTIEYALNFLSYRPRSEKEIYQRLKKYFQKSKTTVVDLWKTETEREKLLNEILTFFKKRNLLNDQEFALWWVQQRNQFRPRGKRMLFAELFKKGIKKEIIQETLESSEQSQKDAKNAFNLAQKKLKALRKKTLPPKFKKQILREKLGRYLTSRGFDWPTIKETLKVVIEKQIK